jgi:phosphoglycolate phosphatase-like HAD superfamily hydrolase
MQPIQAILFDVIGTTVIEKDSEYINNCFADAFTEHGIALQKSAIIKVRGTNKRDAIKTLLNKTETGSEHLVDAIFNSFIENVGENISNFEEHSALPELISFLRTRNVLVGVGSGLPDSVFQVLFDHLNWQRHAFEYVNVFENFSTGRPAPDMIFDMCQRLSIDKSSFLKVGDTVADIEEGINADVSTVLIQSGTQPVDLLKRVKPTYTFKNLAMVESLFE